ncbi:hypothetical protein ACH5RR_012492 [Cinchona calisaya]|uniref:Uncharacterized protein n=1 Tax=Cinchona calisaya TaxID=153742 RepID=A0ABD3A7T6_9GENT
MRCDIATGDAKGAIGYLAAKKVVHKMFIYKFCTDDMEKSFETYQWVLETFMKAMINKRSKSALTDGYKAMRKLEETKAVYDSSNRADFPNNLTKMAKHGSLHGLSKEMCYLGSEIDDRDARGIGCCYHWLKNEMNQYHNIEDKMGIGTQSSVKYPQKEKSYSSFSWPKIFESIQWLQGIGNSLMLSVGDKAIPWGFNMHHEKDYCESMLEWLPPFSIGDSVKVTDIMKKYRVAQHRNASRKKENFAAELPINYSAWSVECV